MNPLTRLRLGPALTYGGAHNDARLQSVHDQLGRAELAPAQRIEAALQYLRSVRDDPERQTIFLSNLPDAANPLNDLAGDRAVAEAASGRATAADVADGF